MTYILSKLASLELEEGKEYYNLQKETLGDEFAEHMRQNIDEIFKSPHLYPIIIAPVHRKVISRFPYNIYYRVDDKAIVILSISHQHREPFYKI